MVGNGETDGDRQPPQDDEEQAANGLIDSDDTTMADAGLVGGTGAQPGESTAHPYGTDPAEDETSERGDGG